MGEQKYRLEENNHTNELILWENEKIINVFKNSYDNRKHLNIIVGRLNEQQATISQLKQENEKLQKQIQNYERLIDNAYVGEEETLDGFVGKYVIWENELQKYKNKNEMIDNE